MQKKVLIILIVAVIIGVVGGFLWLRSRRTPPEVISPARQTSEMNPAQTEAKLLTWNDQAGFAFQYPSGMKINKHDEDKENYAHLDLYLDGKDGVVKILASDTKYKTAEEWATKEKRNSQISGGGEEFTLSGKPARKIFFPDTQTTIIGTVDEEILFTIELVPDKEGFWQKTFDQIVSSFKFVAPTVAPVSAKNGESVGSDIIEEEEIIE